MDCYPYREALSARLDGEPSPIPDEQVERHLDECEACRAWHQRAAELSRAIRVRAVAPTPDLTESVLAAAAPLPDRLFPRWPRILLAFVGMCQLVLGTVQVLGLDHGGHLHGMDGMMSGHLFNESTSWNLALGLGFVWTAVRVRAVAGLLPVLAAFLVVLTGFSVVDLVNGDVTVSRLASHILLVLGLVLLLLIRRDQRRSRPRPAGLRPVNDDLAATDDHVADELGPTRTEDGGRRLGPTGYRRAS
ncbi:zf-HC2 domain-containing protein [Saccharopolyspora spinosa]|uniref:zf-HC2 domain-containing protein n=1 Tax=Saccharopolyspora spinosa TaxID=60894 RepID=UPI0002379F5B|nr:zf-HC2 domain-containing protein [Saccharopolyspora spinosa]